MCLAYTVISSVLVYTTLGVILAFVGTSFLYIMMGAEYLAFMLLIVYVGAIAVLFLFAIVGMSQESEMHEKSKIALWPFLGVVPLLCVNVYLLNIEGEVKQPKVFKATEIGIALYDSHYQYVILIGFILLIATIGAVLLCIKHSSTIKSQSMWKQYISKHSVKLVTPKSGSGVSIDRDSK
ncbi:NADH-quinone oxidoreductase subunit J family protein [Candidatus Fokinia solitaria]|uniref:NADH-quinone oxidoreductase subunit J family protein n=1 Tax=Candidatus Fokinia solitaria TaxID=1802984 RepID=UPI001314B476|nr:NADH-quinone oxidoreductase subunit J [Candidatus Fokinia solitaria]